MGISWRRWLGMDATVRLPAREGYAVWADTYPPRPHNRLMAVEQEIVEPIVRLASPRRALDVGTGTGRYLSLLHAAGAELIVGLDMSMAMLEHRQCKTPRICGDACKLPFIYLVPAFGICPGQGFQPARAFGRLDFLDPPDMARQV